MVFDQEHSDIAIFNADIVKSNIFLLTTNLVADSGAYINNVHSSTGYTLLSPIQDVSSITGAVADGANIVSLRVIYVPLLFVD